MGTMILISGSSIAGLLDVFKYFLVINYPITKNFSEQSEPLLAEIINTIIGIQTSSL